MTMPQTSNRRPLASRSAKSAQWAAQYLIKRGVSPNSISVTSVVFALLGAVALVYSTHAVSLLLITALMIQLRLVCNLLDGMVAVDGGKQSPLGALYNEVPDRVADSLLLIALGFTVGWPSWGWAAALLAALTAYIRVLGGSLGLPQTFIGPMAKPHRMALLTAACLLAVPGALWSFSNYLLTGALVLIVVGSAITCVTRLRFISKQLNGAQHDR